MNRISLLLLCAFTLSFSLKAQILNNSVDIWIENGKAITTKTVTIQVNNPNQRWLGEIEIPFKEGNEPRIHEASILDFRNKELRSLKKKEIVTSSNISDISFYEDNYSKSFNLYWNKYPYRIRYSYTEVTSEFVHIAWWSPVIGYELNHFYNTLTLTCPKDFNFYSQTSDEFSQKVEYSADIKKYTWSAKNIVVDEPDKYSPNWKEILPIIILYPKYFSYAKEGSSESWDTYGNYIYRLNEEKLGLTAEEKRTVSLLLENVTDTVQKIKILYDHLQQNTKYVNVAIDEGGWEPYSASYVCYNKYGDCKALTIYMMALLKYAGIRSNYCLVNAGVGAAQVIEGIPGAQFNHVILGVPLKEDTIWLENTNQIIPFDYLGTFTQGRRSLWVKENGSKLVGTPKMKLNDYLDERKYIFSLDSQGSGILEISEKFGGPRFEHFLKYLNPNENHESEAAPRFSNAVLESFDIQSSEDENKLNLTAKYSCENQIRKVGSLSAISPINIELPSFDKEVRKHPLVIKSPINRLNTTKFKIHNTELATLKLPDEKILETVYGKFSLIYSRGENNSLIVKQNLVIHSQDISTNEYGLFLDFIKRIRIIQNKSSILLP